MSAPEPVVIETRELERAWNAGTLAVALPTVLDELAAMREHRLNVAFQGVSTGTLTPERALSIFQELKMLRDLEQRLRAKARG